MDGKVIIKTLLKGIHKHKKQNNDIFIFTLPRTGSTLLSEILNTNSKVKTASESFALNNSNKQILLKYFDTNFLSERYTDTSNNEFRALIRYIDDISKGKTWNSYYWSDFKSHFHNFKTNRTVFKTHKITYQFDNIMNHYKDDFALYLVRHPISHSFSRIRNNWDTYIKQYLESGKIKNQISSENQLKISDILTTGSLLDKFVLSWCLENFVFFKKLQNNTLPKNILPVTYENLVLNPEKTIKNICLRSNIEYSNKMVKLLNSPSKGIVHSTNKTKEQITLGNKSFILSNWREKISKEEERKAFEILDLFDFNFYSFQNDMPQKELQIF